MLPLHQIFPPESYTNRLPRLWNSLPLLDSSQSLKKTNSVSTFGAVSLLTLNQTISAPITTCVPVLTAALFLSHKILIFSNFPFFPFSRLLIPFIFSPLAPPLIILITLSNFHLSVLWCCNVIINNNNNSNS